MSWVDNTQTQNIFTTTPTAVMSASVLNLFFETNVQTGGVVVTGSIPPSQLPLWVFWRKLIVKIIYNCVSSSFLFQVCSRMMNQQLGILFAILLLSSTIHLSVSTEENEDDDVAIETVEEAGQDSSLGGTGIDKLIWPLKSDNQFKNLIFIWILR